jgi:hypothetical protein
VADSTPAKEEQDEANKTSSEPAADLNCVSG